MEPQSDDRTRFRGVPERNTSDTLLRTTQQHPVHGRGACRSFLCGAVGACGVQRLGVLGGWS